MSISRFRESRGFSAGAAFLFAMILAAVAVAIQMTLPVTTSPASLAAYTDSGSQTAAVNGMAPLKVLPESQSAVVGGVLAAGTSGDSTTAEGQQNPIDPSKATMTTACQPGYDYLVFEKQGMSPITKEWPVCPAPGVDTLKKHFLNSDWGDGNAVRATESGPQTYCVPGPAPLQRFIPNPKLYRACAVVWCAPPGLEVKGAKEVLEPASNEMKSLMTEAKVQCWAVNDVKVGSSVNVPEARAQALAQALPGMSDAERSRILDSLPAYDSVGKAQFDEAYRTEVELQQAQKEIALDSTKADIESIASCKQNSMGCSPGQVEELKRLAGEQKQLEADKARFDKELAYLDKNKSVLTPPDRTDPDPRTKDPTGVGNRDIARAVQSAYGQGGTQFGPGNGVNGLPQSPFGGSCTTGYVCMGNTLYYQSANSYGSGGGYQVVSTNPMVIVPSSGSGQCMTQPMQQCPYGCQQTLGAAQGQQQSTLGGIMAGVQIFSALSSMFGGGNSSVANPNQSRSCAMSPQMQQQQQPQFGTGNQGQPCQQPQTQQPDPSQCSSGSWRANSQNGCFAGWQCVPDGSGGGSQPTAQLSCQPQTADVGMPISFSFSCGNANGSAGTGFSTGGALSGNATTTVAAPPAGQNTATYTLTCIKLGVTTSAQCQVQVGKPGMVMVTNPKTVKGGETATIGWVTSGMKSCVVSSPDQADFTAKNASNTNTSGAVTTSPIVTTSRFRLDCDTLGGDHKQTEATVTMGQ